MHGDFVAPQTLRHSFLDFRMCITAVQLGRRLGSQPRHCVIHVQHKPSPSEGIGPGIQIHLLPKLQADLDRLHPPRRLLQHRIDGGKHALPIARASLVE